MDVYILIIYNENYVEFCAITLTKTISHDSYHNVGEGGEKQARGDKN